MMNKTVITLQTFTIRKYLTNEHDMDTTFRKIKNLGFQYLELARVPFTIESIRRIKRYLDKYDLHVISTQIKLKEILKNEQTIIDIHKFLGAKYISISVIPFRYLYFGERRLHIFIKTINELGNRLESHGLHLFHHHHDYEFHMYKGVTAFDIIANNIHSNVKLLIDTYWIEKGSYSLFEMLQKYQTKIGAFHLRGHNKGKDTNLTDTDFDIRKVIDFAETNNIPYLAIEQATNKPFEELQKSIQAIQKINYTNFLKRRD